MRIELISDKKIKYDAGGVAGFIALTAVLAVSISVSPFHKGEFTLCVVKNIFGIPCPGCGMTRAFLFMGHGHFIDAIKMNPNSPVAFLIVLITWLNRATRLSAGKWVKMELSQLEKTIVYVMSVSAMVSGWAYNLILNPWV